MDIFTTTCNRFSFFSEVYFYNINKTLKSRRDEISKMKSSSSSSSNELYKAVYRQKSIYYCGRVGAPAAITGVCCRSGRLLLPRRNIEPKWWENPCLMRAPRPCRAEALELFICSSAALSTAVISVISWTSSRVRPAGHWIFLVQISHCQGFDDRFSCHLTRHLEVEKYFSLKSLDLEVIWSL